ncbi:MAG: DNA replication/repair protein RecF [Gammaproteobacteria bacterium]|nr:DNA replication/repair protein RecF [Gammaproteobacteria bacterium]MDH3554077.1 DNA replication/repair protein RecF [Gammaproteobacteria bacterium]
MPIQQFTARNFRCLASIELDADPQNNLIYGPNASGKTSVLEALAYLGRGKSFRGAPTSSLIRHGEREFVLFGRISADGRHRSVGVRNSAAGLEVRVDGDSEGGAAALAAALPLQIIDPDVHDLVAGAPDRRRRYLDWIAFHVEHGYLGAWRRFRRVLKQRNAALRSGSARDSVRGWDTEFAALAQQVDAGRRFALEVATGALEEAGLDLLGSNVRFEYRAGWNEERTLLESLQAGFERDLQHGSTQSGPQRADLKLIYDERQARKLVSRGQQKLLACTMVLAATETAQTALERPLLLLLDDPAAELDGGSLERLMRRVAALDCQVIATSLEADQGLFAGPAAVFHVEHGTLERES